MKKKSQLVLSWEQFEHLTDQLAEAVHASGFKPEYLIGIAVGGLVPLALLSRRLEVRDVVTLTARSYDKTTKTQEKINIFALPQLDLKGKRVLLVDEIADTGETLKVVGEILRDRYGVEALKTATVIVNKIHCTFRPDFSILEVDRWVNFPWEERMV